MQIRTSTANDLDAINEVHLSAFGDEEGPEIVTLVHDLLNDPTALPIFSLLAEIDGKIAGHILFTHVEIKPACPLPAQILAPLGVSADKQATGIGSALINAGLEQLTEAGIDLVFVLGHPDYYPKFGFQAAGALGYAAPYPIADKNSDAWMMQSIRSGAMNKCKGVIQCADAMSRPEYWVEQ